jgi:hypothetical protein
MKVRFVFFASVLCAIVAVAAMGAALGFVTISYGDLGDALELRKRHLHASAEVLRFIQLPTRAEADADALRKQWKDSGATDEELNVLGETLETRLVPNANRLIEMADARTNRGVDAAWSALGHAIWIAIGAVVFLLLVTVAVAVVLKRALVAPVRDLARDIEGVAQHRVAAPLESGARIAEFQAIARGYNALTQAIEDEVRARMRMSLEVQQARAAAESAARSRDALAARVRAQQQAKGAQSQLEPLDSRNPASEGSPPKVVDIGAPRNRPRGPKRRRRNQNV